MTLRESIIARAAHAVERLSVKSALNPMLWLSGLVTLPALVATMLLPAMPLWLIFVACAPVAAATVGFAFLLVVDRDKLQSESYQLYSDGVGREMLREWLRKETQVLHWRCDLPHAFYLVAECTAATLARSLGAYLKRRARFLIMEASENRQGWLPAETWEMLRPKG